MLSKFSLLALVKQLKNLKGGNPMLVSTFNNSSLINIKFKNMNKNMNNNNKLKTDKIA